MLENHGDEHCLVCNSICESMDFRSRLRVLLTVPFHVPVTGGDSGGFMSTVAESTATAPWEESVAKSGIIA